ncbi:MAG: CHAT domain-containing protein, partial [Cyanobacteriota bacterium]|nr:CHAT domain-containing protein [Cyanobacteriota bacterium]
GSTQGKEIRVHVLNIQGKLFKEQGQFQKALEAYREAFDLFTSNRTLLNPLNPNIQFLTVNTVESIYRGLIGLLLLPPKPEQPIPQENLKQARDAVEALQIAQIDNFFQEASLDTKFVEIEQIDSKAAVIYPIILANRLAVIVSQPNQPLIHYETDLPQGDLKAAIDDLILHFNPIFPDETRLKRSKQLYDWLIRPGEEVFAANNIETLVFVLDGTLRNLPMAALHDGQQYLVERYQIALAPGLQLLETGNFTLKDRNAEIYQVLAAGLTAARETYSALPGVEREVNQIASYLKTHVLLDRAFTYEALQEQLNTNPFPIVHLATHGQFSSNVEEAFLLAWDGPINIKHVSRLLRDQAIREPIELLVLSACGTATGDKRAALGLAGLAVRSGVRSTLTALWSVNDLSTAELMIEFYRQLAQNPELSKAGALRQAQLMMLSGAEYNHPYYWAPFVLMGNWL